MKLQPEKAEDFLDLQRWAECMNGLSQRTSKEIDGLEYAFESGM